MITRPLRLKIDSVPAADLVAVVEMRTSSSGAHAEANYRFGRAEPRLPEPQRGPAIVTPSGRNLGTPIRIQ